MKIHRSSFFFCSMLFLLQNNAHAQPFTLEEHIKPIELKMLNINPKKANAKGRMAVSNITQVKDTMYFFANGFSIFSPAYVGVTVKDKAIPVQVDLFKQNWKNVNRSGNTGSNGHWQDKFKTEGDFGIRIIAPVKPASYTIIVWNGAEVKPEMPSPFSNGKGNSSVKTTKDGKSGSGNTLLYVIVGLLALIAALLFIKLKNRKS